MTKRAIVTGDFLRADAPALPRESSQHGNIVWLHDLLSFALSTVTGSEPHFASWCAMNKDGKEATQSQIQVDVPAFYALTGRSASTMSWVQCFNRTDPTAEELAFFREIFDQSFVIGFELSPFQRTIFDRLEIPFLSLAIHPLRFGKDLFFYATSNDAHVRAILEKEPPCGGPALVGAASLLKAQAARRPSPPLVDGAALFCLQVGVDSSLIAGARLVSLLDYRHEFAELTQRFPHVYVKKHPFAPADPAVLDFVLSFPNVSLIDGDAYALLAHPAIVAVASLSSSMLSEAEVFGKKAIRFLDGASLNSSALTVGGRVLDGSLWQAMLSPHLPDCRPGHDGYATQTNPIEATLTTSWRAAGAGKGIVHAPVYAIGTTVTFGSGGDGGPMLGAGWNTSEEWGVWGIENVATMSMTMRLPGGADLFARMRVAVTASPAFPLRVDVRCGNHHLTSQTYTASARPELSFQIPAPLFSTTRGLTLSFHVTGMVSPAANNSTVPDTRCLGIGLISFSATPCDGRLPVTLGTRADIRNGEPGTLCLGDGWAAPMDEGCWSATPRASLRFKLVPRPLSDVLVELEVAEIFGAPLVPSTPLLVKAGDTVLAATTLDGARTIQALVPNNLIAANGDMDLTVVSGTILAPSDLYEDKDSVPRGIRLSAVTMRAATAFRPDTERVALRLIGPKRMAGTEGNRLRTLASALRHKLGQDAVSVANFGLGALSPQFGAPLPARTDLLLMDAVAVDALMWEGGPTGADLTIGYALWDGPTAPSLLCRADHVDEIWAPTSFIAEQIRPRLGDRVWVMPLAIRRHPHVEQERASQDFRVVARFKASALERQNPWAALQAFRAASANGRTLHLSLVIELDDTSDEARAALAALADEVADDSNVTVVNHALGSDEDIALLTSADVVLSLHRCEAIGMHLAEAMAQGKPLIATAYSGNMDFMTDDNSIPVDFALIPATGRDALHPKAVWADPNIEQAAQALTRLIEDDALRLALGRKAESDILSSMSPNAISDRIIQRLTAMGAL
ncbi:MAG: glycosyltransferase [Bacteroidota bacterium]